MIRCDASRCVRGLIDNRIHGKDWPQACPVCNGAGELAIAEIARRINERPDLVSALLKPRRGMRTRTAARLCAKLVRFVEPPTNW